MIRFNTYGLKGDNEDYTDFYKNYIVYTGGLICQPNEIVYSITFEECEKGTHNMVGWHDNKWENDEVDFIFKNEILLSVCFPYGLDVEINNNRGRIVYLKIVNAEICSTAGELKSHRAAWDI